MATSANKVNRPTDPKLKAEDINRKLQLYGIIEAFQVGKVPSNEQIDVSINSFLQSRALASPSKRLSPEGQALVADFKSVVEQAKLLLLTKNEGNLLQDFIWQTQQISGGNASTPNAPVDKETAKQHGNDALQGLRTLGTLIISNGQFRKLLSDATVLVRDIAGDAAEKAARKVNPSEDELAQIDKPAEDNTWHDVPDFSRDNIKNQIKSTYNKEAPLDRDDLHDAAGNATQSAHPGDSRDPRDAANLAARDQQQGTNSGLDAQSGAQNGAATLKQRASENMNPETKDRARQTKERTRNYLKDKMPEERRDQTIWRLKKMVVEIQGHPDYNEAITTLLDLAEQYASHANNITQQSVGTVKGAHEDSALKTAEADLKTLIERFANGTSSDDLFDSISAIYRDADRDPELKKWFKSMDAYIRKCLQQQGYILTDSANEEWDTLYDQGNFLLRDRYRNHTDRVVDEFKFLADQFDKDPQNKRFAESVNKLFTDLGNDENGKPTFKPHLIKDLTEVIIPAAFESIAYVPIPRIEYSDPMIDAVIENLVIESDNLLPNIAEFHTTNHHRFGRKNIGSSHKMAGEISVSGIQCDLRDVSFYVNRKQGFPSIKDEGLMDIFMGGNGFSFRAKLASADAKDSQNFFKVESIVVDVSNLKIKMKKSNHKLLFNLFKPMMLKVMKPTLQKVLGKLIKDNLNELDGLLWQVKQEADRAQAEIKNDPQNAPNIYNRYASAFQKNLLQGKQKAQTVASDKKVNVAMTQHDSIFPNVKLPGGISSKATEYKELARKGDKWESPIFSFGSASKTSNIPSPGAIQRKPHQVTTGGVRGPKNIGNTTSATEQNRDYAAQTQGQNGNGFAGANGRYDTDNIGLDNNNAAYITSNGATHTGNGVPRTGNGTANNFSSQVDQAFDEKANLAANGHYNTTLGASNPVLGGTAQ